MTTRDGGAGRTLRAVSASAPGKLILMGEHAAVYGRPALIAAVGLRAEAEVTPLPDGTGVRLEMPDLEIGETLEHARLLDLARHAGEVWRRYAEKPTPARFAELRAGDAGQLVRIAVGEALADLDLGAGSGPAPSFRLRVRSGIPIGAGFGSSAALSVGIVSAILASFEGEVAPERVDRLALAVERRQHGLPSGVDHGTVIRGGVVSAVRNENGGLLLEDLEVANDLLTRFEVFHTGEPMDTTGTVVAAVRALRETDAETFDARLDRMAGDVREFRRLLAAPRADSGAVAALVRDYQRCLEAIGVVPDSVVAAVRRLEKAGVAAKISGAGALQGTGAGCLLVLAADAGARSSLPDSYTPYPVELGTSGLQLEIDG